MNSFFRNTLQQQFVFLRTVDVLESGLVCLFKNCLLQTSNYQEDACTLPYWFSPFIFFIMGCFSFCFDDCWMSLRKPFSSTPFHKRNRDGRRSKILPTFLLSSVPWFLWHLNLIPNEKKENFHHFLFIVDEENDSCIIGCITV